MKDQTRADQQQRPTPLNPRLRRKCDEVLVKAISALPKLLNECESETAAAIVAGLVRAVVCWPEPESRRESIQDIVARLTTSHPAVN